MKNWIGEWKAEGEETPRSDHSEMHGAGSLWIGEGSRSKLIGLRPLTERNIVH